MYAAPRRLRPNDKVAIVAPASPILSDEVQAGIDVMQECGLRPVLGPCVKRLRSYNDHSATAEERAAELNWAFSDPSVKAVIGAVGGVGSGAVLPFLDYRVIKASRKPFLGMSDLTAVQMAILKNSGLISINGQTPSIRLDKGSSIRAADTGSLQLTVQMMMSDQPWGPRPFSISPYFPRTVCGGQASGHVIGCNIETLLHLFGTPYLPDFNGAILFLEDVHKGGEALIRHLLQMRLAGVFRAVNGVVFGEFAEVPDKVEPRVPTIEEVVMEFFSSGIPCAYGYSFSHGPHTSPIPVGATCRLDADTGDVEFDFTMSP